MSSMMRDFLVIIQFVVIMQSRAKELAANRTTIAQVSTDRFVDTLTNRLLSSSLYHSDLDDTTFAKTGQLVKPVRTIPTGLHAMPTTPFSPQHAGGIQKSYLNVPLSSQSSMRPQHLESKRSVGPRANPIGMTPVKAEAATEEKTEEKKKASKGNVIELTKPLGLVLEANDEGKGAKIVEVLADGNAAKVGGLEEDQVLMSVNGKPCLDAPYAEIMNYIKDLDAGAAIKLEVGSAFEDDGTQSELELKLNPQDVGAIDWRRGVTKDGMKVIYVTSVQKKSYAFAMGMRAGMVLKQLKSGVGRGGAGGKWNMEDISEFTLNQVRDKILLSRREVEFELVRNIDIIQDISGDQATQGYGSQYGFGANTLTGDQKNVLIFGSLLAFFALFIGGYALD